jgi:hypothetical protein
MAGLQANVARMSLSKLLRTVSRFAACLPRTASDPMLILTVIGGKNVDLCKQQAWRTGMYAP